MAVFNPISPKRYEIKVEIIYPICFENWLSRLVGYSYDGASANCGKKEGVKTILQIDCEWLTFGWCVAHLFELALKDSLGKTAFSEVDELILCIYYLYKKLPKKLQQLRELVNVCEEMYEFKAGGVCPIKASGLHLLFSVFIAVKGYLTVNFLDAYISCLYFVS